MSTPGKSLTTITVDGKDIRPKDAWWVVFDPEDNPVKAFPSDVNIKTDIARACRIAWMGDTPAILALNEGHHIELMTQARFLRTVAPHLPESE